MQPTVASVGPYSLTIVVSGWPARHSASASPVSCSPPRTSCPVGEYQSAEATSTGRWLGVALTKAGGLAPAPTGASTSVRSTTRTRPPAVRGPRTPVTVRSKDGGECTSAWSARPG
ncbi:hypothetical protein SGRIM128S_02974 [Streptomyces griseomycini]